MIRLVQSRVAFVTAVGNGIGRAIYQRLTQEAAKRVTSDSKVTVNDDSLAMLETIVNSAAIMMRTSTLGAVDQSLWDITTDSNIKGLLLCCKFAVPALMSNGSGAISHIATNQCIRGIGHSVCHPVSKGGIFYLTEVDSGQYPSQGMRAGYVATGGVNAPSIWGIGKGNGFRGRCAPSTVMPGNNDAHPGRIGEMVDRPALGRSVCVPRLAVRINRPRARWRRSCFRWSGSCGPGRSGLPPARYRRG